MMITLILNEFNLFQNDFGQSMVRKLKILIVLIVGIRIRFLSDVIILSLLFHKDKV